MTRDEARLVLLNGLPGVGKSALAAAWSARHPGTLDLDIDVVRSLISGDARETAEPARALGLAMAVEHLRGGHDVVVPQLVARTDQVPRFADAAATAGARFVHVLVEAPEDLVVRRVAADAAPHRRELDAAALAAYRAGLHEVALQRGVRRLMNDDVGAAVDRLEQLLRPAGGQARSPAGR
ncbi:AAA family ATPase [Promicromonospora iranensis]|uniref:Kinase n=1 Tax=Promicromonospora iranensis TaxID=1105144 RepID=A0ABU2CJG8_9MICO|nr:AAA family ATPase [Promicromonospora iranensis]MDR7381477.1 putative kinase [Promicromonospora iranensis]